MSPRDELAAILRSIQPDDVVPDDLIVERIASSKIVEPVLRKWLLARQTALAQRHRISHHEEVVTGIRIAPCDDSGCEDQLTFGWLREPITENVMLALPHENRSLFETQRA